MQFKIVIIVGTGIESEKRRVHNYWYGTKDLG